MKNIILALSTLLLVACATTPGDPPAPPPPSDPTSVDLPAPPPNVPSSDSPPAEPKTIALLTSTGPLIAWDFGLLQIGGTSPALVLTVVNNTSTVSDVLQVSFSGADADQFVLGAGTDCVGQIQLAPGGSCSVRPRFTPSSSGAKTTTLTINGGVAGSASILLSGTGAPPASLSSQPPSYAFGVTEFGHPATETFTISNLGVSVVVQSVSVGGSVSGNAFSVASTTCAGTLGASASCSITVEFNPQTFGEVNANLTIATDHGPFRIGSWVDGWPGARLTVHTTGTGVVYSDGGGYPDIDCGNDPDDADCSGLFIAPNHALAASGHLLSWGGACSGSSASCLVTLSTTETVVTASFAP